MSNRPPRGLVLFELLIVVTLVGLLTAVGMISFSAMWGNLEFKRKAQTLVNLFQMAQDAAAQSDRRYVVVLDVLEQTYVLREFTSLAALEAGAGDEAAEETWSPQGAWSANKAWPDAADDEPASEEADWEEAVADAETIIQSGVFTETFYLDYVAWDDGKSTLTTEDVTELKARFFAGRAGWLNGGVVVLRDGDDNPWSIVISRLGKPVQLVAGEAMLLMPRKQNELVF